VATEGALHDAAVIAPGPGHTAMLEQADLVGRGAYKTVDHVLVGEEVGAFHGVPGVQFEAIAFFRPHDGGGAAFGAHRMRTHHLHFGDKRDVGFALAANADLHRRAQSRQAGSKN
jgi:hypothetical protein